MIEAHAAGQGPVIGDIPFVLNETEHDMPVRVIGKPIDTKTVGALQPTCRDDEVIRQDQEIPTFLKVIGYRIFIACPKINTMIPKSIIKEFKSGIDGMRIIMVG